MNRNAVKKLIVAIMSVTAAISGTSNAEDIKDTLQTMQDFYEAELATSNEPLTKLETTYRSNLAELQTKSQQAGDLKGVVAAKQAIDDSNAGRPPTPSANTEIRTIQKAYSENRKKIEVECAKSMAKVKQSHLEGLRKLVSELTKKGEIENATVVQEKVDEFSAALTSKPVTPGAGATPDSGEWKSKALAEFPDLSNPNTELSRRFQGLKDSKKSTPGYFDDPRWPYLLAKEASQQVAAQAPPTKLSGLYLNSQSDMLYAFSIDESGRVKGIQFHMSRNDGPLISGKCEGGKLTTNWEQIITGNPHEFTFTLLPDGSLDMDGHHGSDVKTRHHETLRRITDQAEYAKLFKQLSDAAKAGEMRAIVNKLKPS